MSYESRTPSVKIVLRDHLFNKLICILDSTISLEEKIEGISEEALKLKEKLLRYSVPKPNDEGELYVDVRFFPNEASNMIWQLLIRPQINIEEKDYYSVLVENRENRKKEKN